MVAEYGEDQRLRRYSTPSTRTRWNLNDRNNFPQWHSDLRRVVRRATTPGFLGEPAPNVDECLKDAEASIATKTRAHGREAQELAHADAEELRQAYDELNVLVYDIIMASIDITASKLDYIERTFGETYDGNALYKYILTHADACTTSVQMQLKKDLDDLHISEASGAEDIDQVLDVIEATWPKIVDFDQTNPKAAIEFALNLIPQNHPRVGYVDALLAQSDLSLKPMWGSFAEFRLSFIERMRCGDLRAGGRAPRQDPNVVCMHACTDDRTSIDKNQCATCDIGQCPGGSMCLIFGKGVLPDQAKYNVRRTVMYFKAYKDENNLKTMKGVRPPSSWFTEFKAKERALKDKEQVGSQQTRAACLPVCVVCQAIHQGINKIYYTFVCSSSCMARLSRFYVSM
ncbi:hypothetical protein AB1Y20_018186 [Prymnesium parvum]|uniref:Uncharacterized protein n=1 Tax=Prymnesium parvum TaxID=97485 RepID=A0AB34JP87_PRYPA